MAEIVTSEPEITTVNEPLLSESPATVPAQSAGGNRTSSRVPMLLGLFAGRRGASLIVQESVALQLQDYREAWGYSLPIVVIETLWNIAFVVISFAMLFWIAREEKNVRLRTWICGYIVECMVNVAILLFEYKKRNRRISTEPTSTAPASTSRGLTRSDSSSENIGDQLPPFRCEMVNAVLYYMWWVVGLGWLLYTSDDPGSPRLFWVTLAFLAMDVFFLALRLIFFILLSAAFCFCLPCIIAVMYYIRRQERASEADISGLPKYRFEVSNGDVEQPHVRACRMIPMETNSQDFSTDLVLQTENMDCCICLCHYEDEEQLLLLHCGHHFHSTCIVKWLMLKANCPVCKSRVPPNEQD